MAVSLSHCLIFATTTLCHVSVLKTFDFKYCTDITILLRAGYHIIKKITAITNWFNFIDILTLFA